MNSCLFLPIGIPGSGKTHLRKKLLHTITSLQVISPDDIRKKVFASDATGIYFLEEREPEIWNEVFLQYFSTLLTGLPIYFDATNLTSSNREKIIRMARDKGYQIQIYWFQIPFWLASYYNCNRKAIVPYDVLKKMYSLKEYPSQDEYDTIQIITKRGNPLLFLKYLFSKNLY